MKRASVFLLALAILLLASPMMADEADSAVAAPVATEATDATASPSLESLFTPEPADMAGCTAEMVCVHPPPLTVSCSSPVNGTCTASGAGCGRVICNGVTTRCPGYCVGDHHCFTFCLDRYGSFEGSCDFGCCECL